MPPDTGLRPQVAPWPEGDLERVARCPICQGTERTVLHEGLRDHVFGCAPGTWTMHRCRGCGAAYLDPRPTPETIGLAYANYFTHARPEAHEAGERGRVRQALKNGYLNRRFGYAFKPSLAAGSVVLRLLPLHRRRCERVVRHLPRREAGKLLDVGCGNGAFLDLMRSQGWSVFGLDVDPEAVRVCQARGLDVRHGTVHECGFPDASFDAITLSHVVEHLHDPVAVLRRCHSLARAGGQLWVETPNFGSASYSHFGRHWLPLDPPRHLVVFDDEALRRLCTEAGWAGVRVSGMLGAYGVSAASRRVRARAGAGMQAAVARTWRDGIRDGLFELAALVAPAKAENLVATATKA